MLGSFVFCLLSAILAVGSPLVCETCVSLKNTTCSGPMKTCEPPDDVCLSNAIEYKFAVRTFGGSSKECSSSAYHSCNSTPFTMTFRPSISVRTYFNCCKDDKCNTPPIELPPYQEEFNGLECPSCFALGATRCLNVDILKCRGNEDHCYEISGTLVTENLNFTKTAAGCASAGVCTKKAGVTNFCKNAVDVLTKFICYPAPKVAEHKTEI